MLEEGGQGRAGLASQKWSDRSFFFFAEVAGDDRCSLFSQARLLICMLLLLLVEDAREARTMLRTCVTVLYK